MGKHHDKIVEALEVRKKNVPSGSGYNTPGSMNKKKTGYAGKAKKRQWLINTLLTPAQ